MNAYTPPTADQLLAIRVNAGIEELAQSEKFAHAEADLVEAIVEGVGQFAAGEFAPLNRIGDLEGARLENGVVRLPDGFESAYKAYVEQGWNAIASPAEFGGQGMPFTLACNVLENLGAANMAFTLLPMLSVGAIEALEHHGTKDQQAKYLPKLVSGAWSGTINLTEPAAGSDVGALRSTAEPIESGPHAGKYRITGQKIYITWGDHDLAENIIHLVLARLPGAPAGSKGISLFIVPKFLVNADGTPGARNGVQCIGLEKKIGIHASPTCVMEYSGAKGFLIGEANKGLACMFTMMNNARLAVGMQGVAICEAATQKAVQYAKDRTQGKAPGWTGSGMSPIIEHPDVARMLVTMKALTQGSRAICYVCAHATDMSHHADGDEARHWAERAALLTPIAKSFATDAGVDVASLGIQTHGGMGFIEETGAARFWRDSRIAPIYEGTNGIQAADLVTRKLPLSNGNHIRGYITELKQIVNAVRGSNLDGFGESADRLDASLFDLEDATEWLLSQMAAGNASAALAGATPYQRLFGLALTGVYLAKGALADEDHGRDNRLALCRVAAENLIAETAALKDRVVNGAASLEAARALFA